jgi:hypothetical protein
MDDKSGSPEGGMAAVSETGHLASEEVLEKLDAMSADDKRTGSARRRPTGSARALSRRRTRD